MAKSDKPRPRLGWREWIGLPELGVKRVRVKVDTGARSSALHASDVEIHRGRRAVVHFTVHPLQDSSRPTVRCQAPLHDERWVRSSNGKRELRPVIRTALHIDGEQWPIDLTLTSRDMMGFRMLLGREAVRGHYVVDPGASFLIKELKPKTKKKKKKKKKKSTK